MVVLALASPWIVRAEETSILVDDQNCLVKPKQVIQLGSPVFGVLSKVFVDRADTVAAGQVVAKLDTSVEEAQLALDRFRAANITQIEAARADLAWNERELARRKQLAGNMFSKANDIDEMTTKAEQDRIAIRKAESDQTTAALEAQRSARQLELKMIRSPVNGVVSEMKLSPGEFIYEQTPIMTIAQIDPLNVDVVLPANRYGVVRAGSVAQLRLEAPVKLTLPATVDAVDPIIDAASDTFRIRLALPNPGNAIPAGIRCSVRFANIKDDALE
jgi:RND family efflux transporter MFP subunit